MASELENMRKQIERLQQSNNELRELLMNGKKLKAKTNDENYAMKQELKKYCRERGFELGSVFTSRNPEDM